MAIPVSQLPYEMLREVRQRKWLALVIFAVVSSLVLVVGYVYPYKYSSQVTIFVDDSNIIKPLMEGSAVTTKISDRISAAQQLLMNRDVLAKVAKDTDIWGPAAANRSDRGVERMVDDLRDNIDVITLGKSYFAIQYTGHDPQKVFLITQRLGQLFLSETDARKKQESRAAYDFIDRQVKAYEQQIQDSEEKLKDFLAHNTAGTETETNSKMADLRGKIELAKLDLQEAQTEKVTIENQLNGVGQTVTQGQTEDIYQTRMAKMQQQLDDLRLKYKDSYPDIVNLKEQIAELKRQHENAVKNHTDNTVITQGQQVLNPLYQTLRTNLANTETKIDTLQTRLKSLNGLLEQEKQRMQVVQANRAKYAELTRGMQVNKDIYDDLLKRREKARVSMRLDLDNQGLSYRIQESAQYPMAPARFKFRDFAVAGLFIGLIAPFGLAAGLLQVDPRVRNRETIEEELGVPVLAVIPQIRTPYELRHDRRRTIYVGMLAVVVVACYIGVVVSHLLGVT